MSETPAMRLELIPLPVSDVDPAKAFYTEKLGFNVDHDVQPGNGMRVCQLTPPGSACSIVIGKGMGEVSDVPPGSVKGLHLVVDNVRALRALRDILAARDVPIGEVIDMGGILFAFFADPDNNTWALQQLPPR